MASGHSIAFMLALCCALVYPASLCCHVLIMLVVQVFEAGGCAKLASFHFQMASSDELRSVMQGLEPNNAEWASARRAHVRS